MKTLFWGLFDHFVHSKIDKASWSISFDEAIDAGGAGVGVNRESSEYTSLQLSRTPRIFVRINCTIQDRRTERPDGTSRPQLVELVAKRPAVARVPLLLPSALFDFALNSGFTFSDSCNLL